MAKSIISNNPAQLVTKARANLTDWTSYTPTFEGITTTSIEAHYRRVGDHIEVKGFCTTSIDNASPFTISLPSGLNLDSTRLSLNSQKLGEVIVTRAATQDVMTSNNTAHIYYGNSVTTKVYGSSQTSTNASGLIYGDEGASNWFGGGSSASFHFSAPIAEWSGSDVTFLAPQPTQRVAYIKDVKASGVGAGTATSGSYQTRDLNTIEGDSEIVSLSLNEFTLEEGKYIIEIECPAYAVNAHKARLYNVTDASVEAIGSSGYAEITNSYNTHSFIRKNVTLPSSKTFRVEHRVSNTRVSDGLGKDVAFGDDEVYTQVKITKLK